MLLEAVETAHRQMCRPESSVRGTDTYHCKHNLARFLYIATISFSVTYILDTFATRASLRLGSGS